MKFCKDCRHAVHLVPSSPTSLHWECRHPSSRVERPIDLVTGRPCGQEFLPCSEARHFTTHRSTNEPVCGPEGQFWEAINRPELSGVIGFGEALL